MFSYKFCVIYASRFIYVNNKYLFVLNPEAPKSENEVEMCMPLDHFYKLTAGS